MHKKSHLDPEYARTRIPWHYDHHMNANQNANWCVTRPWFDYIMGTRVISDSSITETNPLGMNLPPLLERQVNKIARKLLAKSYAKIDANSKLDNEQRQQGVSYSLAGETA